MTSNCMLCVSTAKAYFPDRQSCSTLCRQPFGCARSVEVVAVYPSLGSYSVVGLFRWASPLFKKPFTLNAKLSGQIYTFLQNFFGKLLFAQKSYSVFVHYNELVINPSTYPHWEREKTNPNQESFLLLSLCTYSAHCFCTILCLEKRPSLIWTKRSLLGGVFQKFFDKSAFCTKVLFGFCAVQRVAN